MIEQIALINQIEKLVLKAKQNPTDANVREQLTAVRALCDVVLQSEQNTTFSAMSTSAVVQESMQARTLPKRADIESQSDSIFDF